MNIKLKLMALSALVPMLLSCIGEAKIVDSVRIDDANQKMMISGTPDGVKKGDAITLQLLRKDMKSSDIKDSYDPETLKEDFILIKQVRANADLGYTVSADMAGQESGFYVVRVNGTDEEIYFATAENRQKIIDRIMEACEKDETEAVGELKDIFCLSDRRGETINSFQITDERVFTVTENGLLKAMYAFFNDKKAPTVSAENLKEKTSIAAALCALHEGKDDMTGVKDVLPLDAEAYKIYEEKLSSEAKDSFVKSYFAGKAIYTIEKLNETFRISVMDSRCVNIGNWADAEDVIKTYGEALGINMTTLQSEKFGASNCSKVYTAAADHGRFANSKAFASFLNAKINELSESANSSGSGSSGGTSSGGRGGSLGGGVSAGASVTPPVTMTENKDSEDGTVRAQVFDDLVGFEWATESIEELYRRDVVKGLGDGTFNPGGQVSREEMLAMLLRAFHIAEIANPSETETFTDAEPDGWYLGCIAVAKRNGYIKGYPDGRFGIGESVSRQDAAVMAYHISTAAGFAFSAEANHDFQDDNRIADYAKEAVYVLKNGKVLSGTGDGNFEPQSGCTRAEAAKMIYNLICSRKEQNA